MPNQTTISLLQNLSLLCDSLYELGWGQIDEHCWSNYDVTVDHIRDGPLFFYGGGGGLQFLGLADNFFQIVMHFKQFFSLHFVMKTIFSQPFLKNVTGFFIDLI